MKGATDNVRELGQLVTQFLESESRSATLYLHDPGCPALGPASPQCSTCQPQAVALIKFHEAAEVEEMLRRH